MEAGEKSSNYKGKDFWNITFSIIFVVVSFYVAYELAKRNPNIIEDIALFEFVVISLASFRFIRLFTYDKIMGLLRESFSKRKQGMGRTIYELLICPWCTGIWVTLAVIVLYFMIPYGNIFVLIVGISGVASLIQSFASMMGRIGN